jgi:hypothetical protein
MRARMCVSVITTLIDAEVSGVRCIGLNKVASPGTWSPLACTQIFRLLPTRRLAGRPEIHAGDPS